MLARSYSVDGSSDAAFYCQHCNNLLISVWNLSGEITRVKVISIAGAA